MALSFLGYAILWLGSTVLQKLLTPKIKGPSEGAVDPTVVQSGDEGDPIPVVYGTCRVQPKVTWWGHIKKVPVKEQVQNKGTFNIAHYMTVATDHHVGMQMIICTGPVDALLDIVVDEEISIKDQAPARPFIGTLASPIPGAADHQIYGAAVQPIVPVLPVTNPGTAIPTMLTLLAPNALGGKKSGGGIAGLFRFFWGNDPQNSSSYLAAQITADTDALANTGAIVTMPQWNRVCYCVAEQASMGESPNIRPIQFIVKRCPRFLAGTAEGISLGFDVLNYYDINGDANPAEVILEVLTDPLYGVGITANYDLSAFAHAANYLYRQGMGISASLQKKGSAKEFIEEILRHIDAILTHDPVTGVIGLKLQRPHADPITEAYLWEEATITEEHARFTEVVYPGYRSNVNEVKVTFSNKDRAFQSDVAQAQELALMEMSNGDIISETYDYPMFTTHDIAQQKAFQILRELRGPTQVRMVCNRSFGHLGVGSLVVLTAPSKKLFGLRCRVTKVDSGTMVDGEIEIEAIEDVFASIGSPYSAPSGNTGQPTNPNPAWKEPLVTPFSAQNFAAGTAIPGNGTDPGGTIGLLELGIDDPAGVITDIDFWKQTGHGARTGPVAFNMANIDTVIPSEYVVLDPTHESTIWWVVTYTDQDGTVVTKEGTAIFGKTDALAESNVRLSAEIVDFGDSATPADGCAGVQRLWNVKLTVTPRAPAVFFRWASDVTPPVSQAAVEAMAQDTGGYTLGAIDSLVFAANSDTIFCREVPPFQAQIGILTANIHDENAAEMAVFNMAHDGKGGFLFQQVPDPTNHMDVLGIVDVTALGVDVLGTPYTLDPLDPVGTLIPLIERPSLLGVDLDLDDLGDVEITSSADGDHVVFDDSDDTWKNQPRIIFAADQAAMLALPDIKRGQQVYDQDEDRLYEFFGTDSTDIDDWKRLAHSVRDLNDTNNVEAAIEGDTLRKDGSGNFVPNALPLLEKGAGFSAAGAILDLSGDTKVPVVIATKMYITAISIITVGGPGDVEFGLKKVDVGDTYPADLADITGGNNPTLTAGDVMYDSTLTGWTGRSFEAGDILEVELIDVSGLTHASIVLYGYPEVV